MPISMPVAADDYYADFVTVESLRRASLTYEAPCDVCGPPAKWTAVQGPPEHPAPTLTVACCTPVVAA